MAGRLVVLLSGSGRSLANLLTAIDSGTPAELRMSRYMDSRVSLLNRSFGAHPSGVTVMSPAVTNGTDRFDTPRCRCSRSARNVSMIGGVVQPPASATWLE